MAIEKDPLDIDDIEYVAIRPREMAKLWQCGITTCRDWTKKPNFPEPVHIDGRSVYYPLGATIRFVREILTKTRWTKSPEELRKIEADAQLAELRGQKLAEELIPIEDAVRIFGKSNGAVKQAFRGLPSRMAPRLVGIEDANEIAELLEAELARTFQTLSRAIVEIRGADMAAQVETEDS